MPKKYFTFILFNFILSCVPIEKTLNKSWNKLGVISSVLESEKKVSFNYNVKSRLKKNQEIRFFKNIDSLYVMNLKPNFEDYLSSNKITIYNNLENRYKIEISKFDFKESRNYINQKDYTSNAWLNGHESSLSVIFISNIIDLKLNEKKLIEFNIGHKTKLQKTQLSKYFFVERGENIDVDILVNNSIINFSNQCAEFIKIQDQK